MYFKKIESEGLAHYSYIIGDEGEAAVIDPRRDVEIYLDEAREEGLKIKYIFETHRNEDYIIGSMELSEKTNTPIYISGHEDLGYEYGEKIFDGDTFEVGNLKIKAIHTPGHTLGHLSYAFYYGDNDNPLGVFTGDCLFMGDLGRTDFYGEENLDEMTGKLYDSIFETLFSLGEGVLVFPAHGAGSACGDDMEDRPFSTIGYEKKNNPQLQVSSREEFIEEFGKMRIKPRYFEKMEVFNVKGAPFVGGDITISPVKLEEVMDSNLVILDCRGKEAFWGGHIPGSYFLSVRNFTRFAGNLFPLDTPLVLNVSSEDCTLDELYWRARRIGFDNIKGYLDEGVESVLETDMTLESLPTIKPKEFLELEKDFILLDVRLPEDIKEDSLSEQRVNIPLQELYKDFDKLDKDKKIYVVCASGDRATAGAAFIKNEGYDPTVVIGGMMALEPLV